MDILKPSRFDDAAILYPNDKAGLYRCLRILKVARPKEFADLQKLFGTHGIDLFKPRAAMNWVVIDVGGNNLRVLGAVNYTRQKFYVKHIYTHADYDVANVWYARNKGVKR
ncbi:type II toxin-antitoxin system HigB family toxin [Pseudomonas sp. TH10]|jgi:mRNA interferase HigB|uniref:type II toxin-antitoxin system HigB family toxin n=1 Tax=Pseudomonas sp. TH10 TaxID=2796376 RepID=UPI001914CA09|nr:type II toxin-antitoxin system HigB family toxin [Pseudomonas sp. TH10]MBK5519304.1 type II toxin-antitoxin system HigB family toxin [Pseudomonas sp. TH10]